MLQRKTWMIVLLKFGIATGLILWLVEKVQWSVVFVQLRDISLFWLLGYVVLQLIALLISAKKWQMIASYKYKHQRLIFTVQEGFFAYLTGAFINNFLPSTLGGDAYRGLWLARKTEAKAASLSTVVFDRFIGLWTTALLALFCSIPLWHFFASSIAFRVTLLGLTVFLLGDLFVTYAYFRPWLHRILLWLPSRLRRVLEEVIGFTRKGIWISGSLYSILFALVGVGLSNWMLFHAINSTLDLPVFLSVIFLVTIVSSIPISINNIGVKEWAYVTFFTLVGVSAEVSVTVALLSRFLQMIISFIALPHYFKTHRNTEL